MGLFYGGGKGERGKGKMVLKGRKIRGRGRDYNPYDVIASKVLELAVKDWNALFFQGGGGLETSETYLEKGEKFAVELGFEDLGEELIQFFSPENRHFTDLVFLVGGDEKHEWVRGSGSHNMVRRSGFDCVDIRKFIKYKTCEERYRKGQYRKR